MSEPTAREEVVEAMARAMDDWDRDPVEQCLLDCTRALDALLASPALVPLLVEAGVLEQMGVKP